MKLKKLVLFIIPLLMLPMFSLKANAAAVSGIISGETYWIVNAHSGKVLDVDDLGTTSGTNVLQWSNNNGSNQKWVVSYNSSGDYYTIRPTHTTGMYLTADSSTLSNNVNACIKTGYATTAARWSLHKKSSTNGNYIIRSKINVSYALTVSNARTDNGANVMLYTYSSGNNCNDEWIFVKCSGSTIRSVNIAIQQDQTYLSRYSSQPNEINKTIADAAKPFYSKWHIEFRPSYYTLSSMKLDDCSRGNSLECNTSSCGSTCINRKASPNHHKNFNYNALNAWDAYGMDGNDMRLVVVGIQLCRNIGSGHENTALGWWPEGNNGMAQQNNGHTANVRVIQHEISHTYGAIHCEGASGDCLMNGNYDNNHMYNIYNIWCPTCISNFDRTAY